jgi:hypothetical protein
VVSFAVYRQIAGPGLATVDSPAVFELKWLFFLDLSMVDRRLHDDLRKIYLHLKAPRFDLHRTPVTAPRPRVHGRAAERAADAAERHGDGAGARGLLYARMRPGPRGLAWAAAADSDARCRRACRTVRRRCAAQYWRCAV